LNDGQVFIVAPKPADPYIVVYRQSESGVFPHIAITSGNMLNLELYKENGPCREDFFIDFVDIEYCLRAKKKGLRVTTLDSVVMEHHIGKPRKVLFFTTTNHPPSRRYYITRNRIAVWREYFSVDPEYVKYNILRFAKETAKTILGEHKKSLKFF